LMQSSMQAALFASIEESLGKMNGITTWREPVVKNVGRRND